MLRPPIPAKLLSPRYSVLGLFLFTIVYTIILSIGFWFVFRWWHADLIQRTFQSPLPEARVAAENSATDPNAYEQAYDFTVDWFTRNIPVWETVLADFEGREDVHYLEIGVYEGRSLIWALEQIFTHPTSTLTGIDIFDGPHKERYLSNIEQSGASHRVTTITDFSQLALRKLPLNSYDVIYIDGSHAKEDVLEDAVLCWRLLRPNGILIFDDYRWGGWMVSGTSDKPTDFPKPGIDSFVQCFREHLHVLHNSYQLIVKKVDKNRGMSRQ